MSTLSVTVPGTAVPQGSMRLVRATTRPGGSRMIHSNKNLNSWRTTVARHTLAEIQQTERRFGRTFPLTGPINLIVVFTFPRPKHHYRQGKFANLLRAAAPRYMQVGPDLDKLVRAIGDALVAACAIVDDKQINVIHAGKKWADGDPQTTIEIWGV